MEHGTGGLRDPEQAHSYPATLGVREHVELIDPVAAKGNEADQTVEVDSAPDIAVLDDTGPEESLVLFRRVPSGEPWQPFIVRGSINCGCGIHLRQPKSSGVLKLGIAVLLHSVLLAENMRVTGNSGRRHI